jgi:hypothetical protein
MSHEHRAIVVPGSIPEVQPGNCPVCTGAGRASAEGQTYARIMAGFDAVTNTLPCRNCGGQYQWGRPTGNVRLRPDGTPCTHEYSSQHISRALCGFTCWHCADHFEIDSGD